MNKNYTQVPLTAGMLLLTSSIYEVKAQNCTAPPVGCGNTDFTNSFSNSSDPDTNSEWKALYRNMPSSGM